MGLLDDAIREHLDLKRRRGADPAEVERAEREALGPVRRGPEEPLGPQLSDNPSSRYEDADEAWYSLAGEHVAHPEQDAYTAPASLEDYAAHDEELYDEPGERDEYEDERHRLQDAGVQLPAPQELRFSSDFDDQLHGAAASDWGAPEPPHAPEAPTTGHDETVEFDVQEAIGRERADHPAADDMLEKTPEFLQDTPDHDRLWFEQKPPRDFDFDG
jgi:hypothetical protein